jgi:cellulose 1,4-beta-cellobiosidase
MATVTLADGAVDSARVKVPVPPGESDGTYPALAGKGDPHCDPNGSYTDGSGNTFVTDAIPSSPPAGTWFPVALPAASPERRPNDPVTGSAISPGATR